MRLSFGDFVVDFDERRLLSGRQEIRLTPKAFDLLRLLVEHRPKALSKRQIFERLWPGTFVTENNLAATAAMATHAIARDDPLFVVSTGEPAHASAFLTSAADCHRASGSRSRQP
jgi:DNA-binding winged helix-turn-helix (wHTH) protein